MTSFRSIEWHAGKLSILDQRALPHETKYIECENHHQVADAIRSMAIRGAPAIGAAAAYGLALVGHYSRATDLTGLRMEIEDAAQILRSSRPTAVNLSWAIDRMWRVVLASDYDSLPALQSALCSEANAIAEEDILVNRQIGLHALPLIPEKARIIHHCNTGSLATADYGTALGAIRTAHEHGKEIFVLVDETRPRLQGARLTAWELKQYGIPFMVIVDGASGHYMRTMSVDLCIVGCDRVAANGDTANKIGTYNLAVVAHENGIPFYVAAPTATIDMQTPTGDEIEIEERSPMEITHLGETQITPDDILVGNAAFDVTPAKYISAIITELGVVYPPFAKSLAKLL